MNKLEWYINRFSLMSPMEIGHRVKDEISKKVESKYFKDFVPDISFNDRKVNWYFQPENKQKLYSFLKENDLWDENKTQEILDHKASFFSLHKKFLGEKIDWHRDYKNLRNSPIKYCKKIDYRNFNEVGDFKYIWEINRHQHLILLAKAYYLTGNEDYKKEVIEQISSWIQDNPYLKGINWESSMELGVRLISWSWVWFFIGEVDDEFEDLWLKSIYKHCKRIYEKFARHSSANNHLIGEAAGLFIASIVWPFEKGSLKWQRKSFKILNDEVLKQNYKDGVNKEQAMSYQQFVLDFFILSGLLGEKNSIKFPEGYWRRIEKMIEFAASIMDKSNNIPNIGDSDDGYAVILSDNEEFNPYLSIIATGAVKFNRGDLKGKCQNFDEKSLWLLGCEGLEAFVGLSEKRFISTRDFDEGGYYLLYDSEGSEDEVKCVFDCGPLGYLSLAAHGHADALSFTLSIGGKEFLIDPGTYVYQNPKEWRNYFRGTAAHNTVRIDKEDQSVVGGNFMWIKKAKASKLNQENTNNFDLVEGSHDGYERLKDPVIHRRQLMFDKKLRIIKVVDSIEAKEGHLIEQFFHFSQDCLVTKSNTNGWRVSNGDKKIVIDMDKQFQTSVFNGSEDPIFGWKSSRFDVKEKTNTIVNSCEKNGRCEFETVIKMGEI